jgi:hypothetical protein
VASTGTNKNGQFQGVASFVRLPLQINVQQGLKKSANIQGGSIFSEGPDLRSFTVLNIQKLFVELPADWYRE